MSEGKGIAGGFFIGDGMNHYASGAASLWPFKSEPELRAYIEGIVRAVLEDDARAICEHKAFQPVSVDTHATDPMVPAVHIPAGICWACGQHGESAEMMWRDQFGRGSHLIHATEECITAAQSKPEQREHRG